MLCVFITIMLSDKLLIAIKSSIRMRDDLTLIAWHGVMADEERFINAVEDQHKYCEKYAQNGYQIFTQRSR